MAASNFQIIIQTRLQTIHLNWIKYIWLHPRSLMAGTLQEDCANSDLHFLLRCKTDHTTRVCQHRLFMKQIFTTWARFHIQAPNTEEEVQKETLWENDFILIEKKPIIWNTWKDAGIVYINDFLHDFQPHFLSHVELQDKFGIKTSFLQILQIRTAIPCTWKWKIVGPGTLEMVSNPVIFLEEGTSVNILRKSQKFLYSILIKFQRTAVTSQARWKDLFPIDDASGNIGWRSTKHHTRL